MAHQGRCSAAILSTILLLCLHSLITSVSARAAVYTVGDDSGWTFSVEDWTKGKKFKAGDILNFNYYPTYHNVAAVDVKGYKSCSASSKAKIYTSGKDRIKLSKGRNYYICSIPGHCDEGMKINVYAH